MSRLDAPVLKDPIPEAMLADPTKAWAFAGSPQCDGVRLDEGRREQIRALCRPTIPVTGPSAKISRWT